MWQLTSETDIKRNYRNDATGTTCSTSYVYTDVEGNRWFTFDNLFTLPFMRQFAATKISSLYQIGLSKEDIEGHINGLKTTLKSTDTDKYEKCYALVLDFESKFQDATNVIKQISALVCVYNMLEDERIDVFEPEVQERKKQILDVDLNAQAFFLRSQIERTEIYGNHLDLFSKTASAIREDISEATGLNGVEPK
jgi:hypothetical protein